MAGFDLASILKGGVEGVLDSAAGIIGKFKANPDIMARAKADVEVAEANLAAARAQYEQQIVLAQLKINEVEAGSADAFTSRWRPMVGWVCCAGLAYAVAGFPFLVWASRVLGWPAPPELDVNVLMTLLFGMLGIGSMRSFDKVKGTTAPSPPGA